MNYTPTTIETLKVYFNTGACVSDGISTPLYFTFCNYDNQIGNGKKIILYPLHCLTEEITVPNYNDGKPFVPVDEIRKEIWSESLQKVFSDYAIKRIKNGEIELIKALPFWIVELLQGWFINYQNLDAINPFDLPENPYKK